MFVKKKQEQQQTPNADGYGQAMNPQARSVDQHPYAMFSSYELYTMVPKKRK